MLLLFFSSQDLCYWESVTMNPVPEECTTNKPKDEVLELGKASCYYKLMMIESFYVPSIYCSIRYMLLPNQYVGSSLNIIITLLKVLLHSIQLLDYILQLLTTYLISNPCAVITLFKRTIFTSTLDFLTQSSLNFLLQPKQQ